MCHLAPQPHKQNLSSGTYQSIAHATVIVVSQIRGRPGCSAAEEHPKHLPAVLRIGWLSCAAARRQPPLLPPLLLRLLLWLLWCCWGRLQSLIVQSAGAGGKARHQQHMQGQSYFKLGKHCSCFATGQHHSAAGFSARLRIQQLLLAAALVDHMLVRCRNVGAREKIEGIAFNPHTCSIGKPTA